MILRALRGKSLPLYGDGNNIRDWIHVEDHASALITILERAEPGSTYNVSCDSERRNLNVVEQICDIVDQLAGELPSGPRRNLIRFVEDRPGHDRRYAMDASKLRERLGWQPAYNIDSGLRSTVRWYLDNDAWWEPLVAKGRALERLGLASSKRA
jgi:dTDP-glucose 4,6-dehydratase